MGASTERVYTTNGEDRHRDFQPWAPRSRIKCRKCAQRPGIRRNQLATNPMKGGDRIPHHDRKCLDYGTHCFRTRAGTNIMAYVNNKDDWLPIGHMNFYKSYIDVL